MGHSQTVLRLASSVCLLALAACSGGGGGGSVNTALNNTPSNTGGNTSGSTGNTSGNTSTGNTSGNTSSPPAPTPTVSIGAPDRSNVSIQPQTFNFSTNLPPVGTVFGFIGPAVRVAPTTVDAPGIGNNATATFRGMVTSGSSTVPVFDISIPSIGLAATNVRGDGSTNKLGDGGEVLLTLNLLNYTAVSAWAYKPATGSAFYVGQSATGSGTPIGNVPVSGSATYTGIANKGGGAVGQYFIPSGTGEISFGFLTGDATLNVNFTSGAVTGSLSNITASSSGVTSPWNTISLSGNVNRLTSNASITGTTSTSGAPGAGGFSSAATGNFGGAFFGPNADELGGTWTLTDPTAAGGGKTAFGGFGATSNGCSGCSTSGTTTPPPAPTPGIAGPTSTGVTAFGSGGALGTSFTSNPPSVGTQIVFGGNSVNFTSTAVGDAKIGEVRATYRGTVTSGSATVPVFDLSIPALSLTANNVRGDGTTVTLPDGGKVGAAFATLNYTMLGAWSYVPASGAAYLGQVVTGYATPGTGMPTSGSATYTGSGGVVGAYFVPGTSSVQAGTLSGDVSLNVNFASNSATGSFTNMQAKAAGSSTTTPWNDVSLTSTSLNRNTGSNSLSGLTSTTTNSGPAGFSSAAKGGFTAGFYGPAAQEIGGNWVLSESTGGGKAAFGTFGAKQ